MNVTAIEKSADRQTLFLTLNRTFQQHQRNKINQTKIKLKGLPFRTFYEKPMFCGKRPYAIFHSENGKITDLRLDRIRCHSWRCPDCAPIKAKKVKNLIRETAIINDLKYFLTLTLDPEKIPPEYFHDYKEVYKVPRKNFEDPEIPYIIVRDNQTHKYITKLFNTLMTNIRRFVKREFGETDTLKYIWVLEFQKNGNAHLHILLNTRLPIEEVRKVWSRIGGGHIMFVDEVRDIHDAAAYLAKYFSKNIQKFNSGQSFHYFERRYSISKSCIRPSKMNIIKNEATEKYIVGKMNPLRILDLYSILRDNEFPTGHTYTAPKPKP